MTDAELKPCPFCSGAARLITDTHGPDFVNCVECGVCVHPDEWNRRASDSAREAGLEERPVMWAVVHKGRFNKNIFELEQAAIDCRDRLDAAYQDEPRQVVPLYRALASREQAVPQPAPGTVSVPEKVLWDAVAALERAGTHVTGKQKSDAAMALRVCAAAPTSSDQAAKGGGGER